MSQGNVTSVKQGATDSVNVGLLWHSANSGNLGVGALTIANMQIVRAVAEEYGISPRFCIIGMRDAGPKYVDDGAADVFCVDTRALISPSGCWALIRRQDVILDIGAGDSFAEIYGFKRFFFLWWTKILALMGGVPLILSPQTIGPIERAPYVQMAHAALTRARAVLARDPQSLVALTKIAPLARGRLAVDVAFALPYDDRSAHRGGPLVRVGVNVSGLLMAEAESGRNHFGLEVNYAELMRRFVADLSERPDVEVHLIAHAIDASGLGRSGEMSVDDDNVAVDRFAKEFPNAVRAPSFAGPSEAKTYISGLDFLVAGRMHACIAAFSSGTPVVPVAYSRKFSGLFGMLGYERMIPVTGMSTEDALNVLHECLRDRECIRRELTTGMVRVDELMEAYRAELREMFRGLGKTGG